MEKIKNIFLPVIHNNTKKIKLFGLFNPVVADGEKKEINLNDNSSICEFLPVFEEQLTSIIDIIAKLVEFGFPTIDSKDINHLGQLTDYETKTIYNCYELDFTNFKDPAPMIDWFDAKDTLKINDSLFLSLIFRLFMQYYLVVYGENEEGKPKIA